MTRQLKRSIVVMILALVPIGYAVGQQMQPLQTTTSGPTLKGLMISPTEVTVSSKVTQSMFIIYALYTDNSMVALNQTTTCACFQPIENPYVVMNAEGRVAIGPTRGSGSYVVNATWGGKSASATLKVAR